MGRFVEGKPSPMLQALLSSAGRLLRDLNRAWVREQSAPIQESRLAPVPPGKHRPLQHVTLTDEVGRTLFEEYAAHRKGERGGEETGWILLGLREAEDAVALATLPAGAQCNAGVAHVHFNSSAQAVGSCMVRQLDRRLTILGVVHTHPGTLRHPSDGDFRGDSVWVSKLRGGEGVFGIGTVEAKHQGGALFARQPRPNMQTLGDMCFSWYALRKGDADYRPLPYRLTLGPDLARPLHSVWPTIEAYAEQLERLHQQQAGVTFEVIDGKRGPALSMNIPLSEPKESVRVLLEGKEVRYYLMRDGDLLEADSDRSRVDRGVYLLLAELAAQC